MSPPRVALLAVSALLGAAEATGLAHHDQEEDVQAPWWQVYWAMIVFNGVTIVMGSVLAFVIWWENRKPLAQAQPLLAGGADVPEGSADVALPENVLETEKALKLMMRKVATCGLLQFPSMIIFFNIALFRGYYDRKNGVTDRVVHYIMKFAPAPILAGKAVYFGYWQYSQLKVMEELLKDESQGFTKSPQELNNVLNLPWKPCWWCPSWCLTAWIPMLLLGLPEAVDPDFDATTAGNADGMLLPAQELKYANAWCQIPVPSLGTMMARLGLPSALQLSICISVFVQAGYLIYLVRGFHGCLVKFWPDKTKRSRVFSDLAHVADVSNMMLLSEAFLRLRQGEVKGEDEDRPVDRIHGFVAKTVFETLPASWLQVSLLALSWGMGGEDLWTRFTTLFSVITSLVSMGKALYTAVPHLRYQLTVLRSEKGKGCHRILICNAFFVPLTVLAVIACCIRVVGVFHCPHHIFNILQFRCVEHFSNVSCLPCNGTCWQ